MFLVIAIESRAVAAPSSLSLQWLKVWAIRVAPRRRQGGKLA
jgi:hypothetical protein